MLKLPKWLYQFSFKREPILSLIFSLFVLLIGMLSAVILPRLAR
jgi:hypothetical protein